MDRPAIPPAPAEGAPSFIAQGASAELFDMGGGQVLKLFRESVSDEMIAREVAASVHAAAQGVPAAAAIGRFDRDGRRGILYPRLEGVTLIDWIRHKPLRAGWALDAMGAIHAAMHARGGGGLRSLKQVLATDIAYGPAPRGLQQAAIARLGTLPDAAALTHGDLHLGNVMMTPQGIRVIDWSKAAAGPPAADAVRSEMLMRFGAGPTDWVTNLWRDWAARRLRTAYKAGLAGGSPALDTAALRPWRAIVALAWLRARDAGRTPAFLRYLDAALSAAGLGAMADWGEGRVSPIRKGPV